MLTEKERPVPIRPVRQMSPLAAPGAIQEVSTITEERKYDFPRAAVIRNPRGVAPNNSVLEARK